MRRYSQHIDEQVGEEPNGPLGPEVKVMNPPKCHGSTGSPLALMRRVLRGGVTVLEGAGVLARGTRSCT